MDVRCDKCGTDYEFDEARIGSGVTVKCTACGHVFRVKRASPSGPAGGAPKAREWLVKKPDSQMIAFRELTTLQKWIVEGRINRDDEISKNGETWKRLGNISELEPFFSVFERAKALNELMTTGSIGDRPIVVNGSEVLATMSPLSSVVAASSPIPDRTAPAMPLVGHADEIGARAQASIAGSVPPPRRPSMPARPPTRADRTRGPSMVTRRPDLAGFEAELGLPPTPGAPMRPAGLPGEARTEDAMPALQLGPTNGHARAQGNTRPVTHESETMPAPPNDLSLPRLSMPVNGQVDLHVDGPASIHDTIAPRDLLSAEHEGSDIVRQFRRHRRYQGVWISAAAFLVLGLVGGAAFALLGPTANPLQVIAQRYGLIPATAPTPDPADAPLEAARRAFELDTLPQLAEAAKSFEAAIALRPADASLKAELALVLTAHADTLRRSAAEHDQAAADTDATKAGDRAKALHEQAEAERKEASALIKRAFELARAAYEIDPNGLAATRAFADYYRVQRDKEGRVAQMLALAKAAAQARGTADAFTLYVEAAEQAKDPTSGAPADLEHATRLLEEALTLRPTLVRARVLLARIMMARQQNPLAAAELRRALESSPDHEEAKRLLTLATQVAPAPAPVVEKPVAEKPAAEKPAPKPVEAAPAPTPEPEAPAPIAAPEGAKPPVESRSFETYLKQADRYRERGDAQEALDAYEKAAELRPASGRAYAGMGWAYLDLGKAEAALHQFRKAISVESSHADGHLGYAEAYRALGNDEKALAAYRRYLGLRPSGPGADSARRAIAALGGAEEAAPEPSPSE